MTIVITLPDFFDGEAGQIVQLLHSSIDLVHIRKPDATLDELENLLLQIPAEYHSRLVLHDHHSLAVKYHLHGIHLNGRNPLPPAGWTGSVSRSCHSLGEVKEWKAKCDYVSLSPIFDSISKQGYHAAFSHEDLAKARAEGIIDRKVLALGGVTFHRIDEVLDMGFGGGMILGNAWKKRQQPVALSIAGSDSSAGAGIQQDLKTMSAVGVYGATVITAVTSQNTLGVSAVLPMPPETVASQLEAVFSDLRVTAVKIGMVPDAAVAHAIAQQLAAYKQAHDCAVIYDPVMVSTSGKRLMEVSCVETVTRELFPLCTIITPNLPETERLLGKAVADAEEAGISLARRYHAAFLVKGGHRHSMGEGHPEPLAVDYLCHPHGGSRRYESHVIESHNLHGTGCTLSSAIASYLVKGLGLEESVECAKRLVTSGILKGSQVCVGKGNGPLWLT